MGVRGHENPGSPFLGYPSNYKKIELSAPQFVKTVI